MAKKKKPRKTNKTAEGRQLSAIEKMRIYQALAETIPPELMKDLADGMPVSKMREKWLPFLTVKKISLGLTSDNPETVNRIEKDFTDRIEGKPTEKKEIAHRLAELSDQELDAYILSEQDSLDDLLAKVDPKDPTEH